MQHRPFPGWGLRTVDMTRHHLLILTLTIVGISFLQWFISPSPIPIRPARLGEEPWKLPEQIEFDVKASLATLNSASLWGKLAEIAPNAPLNEPEWRFLGALVHGKERQVIIQIEGQPEQRLVPGDTLPGGSEILDIESDRLCLLIDGKRRSLAIYPHGALSGSMPMREAEAAARGESAKRVRKRNP